MPAPVLAVGIKLTQCTHKNCGVCKLTFSCHSLQDRLATHICIIHGNAKVNTREKLPLKTTNSQAANPIWLMHITKSRDRAHAANYSAAEKAHLCDPHSRTKTRPKPQISHENYGKSVAHTGNWQTRACLCCIQLKD